MSTTRGNNDPTKDADPNWPWRQPPRSRDEALDWAVEAICLWRKQAGVLWKPDRGGLEAILDDLETKRHGQGCEWLLRVGKVTSADVDAMLVELEEALGEQMAPALAYWVTEVLEGPLKARVTKEGRKLVALGMYLPMARLGLRRLFARAEPAQRVRPERLVPKARGRIPWPAPWVAGALVREILDRRGLKSARRPLRLTQALFGRRQIEPVEFKAQTRGLTSPVLEWWVEGFESRYAHRFADASTSELWGASFYSDLAVHGPEAVFPSDHERTHELLRAYGAVRRLHSQKPGRMREP